MYGCLLHNPSAAAEDSFNADAATSQCGADMQATSSPSSNHPHRTMRCSAGHRPIHASVPSDTISNLQSDHPNNRVVKDGPPPPAAITDQLQPQQQAPLTQQLDDAPCSSTPLLSRHCCKLLRDMADTVQRLLNKAHFKATDCTTTAAAKVFTGLWYKDSTPWAVGCREKSAHRSE
jgi:hypothetical protein